jgi:hypothetical protein
MALDYTIRCQSDHFILPFVTNKTDWQLMDLTDVVCVRVCVYRHHVIFRNLGMWCGVIAFET